MISPTMGSSRRVLVVDAEPGAGKLLRRHLTRDNVEVLEATTTEHGFALATARQPDVVVIDLGLIDGNGLTLLARLKADPRTAPISLVVWSENDATHDSDAVRAGALACFEKKDIRTVASNLAALLLPRL